MSRVIKIYISDKEKERIIDEITKNSKPHKIEIVLDKELTIEDLDMLNSLNLYLVKGEEGE